MKNQTEEEKIKQTIQALEAQRQILGDDVVEAAIAPLQEKLAALQTKKMGEQRKLVTILFADLAGFTELANRMDAEDVREIMNAYFARWSVCIQRQEGVVEKFIGDAVLAVFGLPGSHEDDPERAIRAALDMQKEMQQFNDALVRERNLRLSMRVGINTGEVVVSLMGERQGEEFIVVGDAVNLTSRLQAAAPPDGILVTQATYRHVRGLFEAAPFGPLELKGISQPVQAYWIKAAKPKTFRTSARGVEGTEAPMVGRQGEFDQLKDIFFRAVKEKQRFEVTIVGEAGFGKSRLLHEFQDWVELRPERVFFFYGRAYPSSQYAPYSLMRDLFAFRSEIQDSDPPQVVREKLTLTIGAAFEKEDMRQLKAHFIARLLGFEIGESEYENELHGDAKWFHDRAIVYLGDYFRAVSAAGPAMILVEDLHWADDRSLDLMEQLAVLLAERPFLIICTTRPALFERRPDWEAQQPFATRLDLNPLPKEASRVLVEEILKQVDFLPESLQDLVVNTAEGNPYYIEELIQILIEDGVIVKGGERWKVEAQRLGDLRVPPTLVEVLQARFDSLAFEERDFLQRGAVIGRVFWDEAVESLGAANDAKQMDSLTEPTAQIFDQLRRREMIFRNDKSTFENTTEYLFKHALLRDVTYTSLLKRQRRVYHDLAARWLETVTNRTHRANEFAMLIAEHYELAEAQAQAAAWYLRAGRQAAARFANLEAVRAFGLALDLNPNPSPQWKFDVLVERVKVYELLGKRAEQLADIDMLQATAQQTGDIRQLASADFLRAQYAFLVSDFPTALAYAQQAEEMAQRAQHLELAARCSFLQASALLRQGEYTLSDEHARWTLALAGQLSLPGLEAEGYRHLGLVAYYEGKSQIARDHFTQALQLFEQAGDRQGEGLALNNLGGATFQIGEYEEAGRFYSLSLKLCREIGDRAGESRALNNLGIVSVSAGQYAQGEEYYLQALQIAKETGQRSNALSALDNLGNIGIYRYHYSLAEKYILEALQGATELGDQVSKSYTLVNLSRLYLCLGDYEQAQRYIQESLDINRQLGDQQGICHALINLSGYQARVADFPSALETSKEALALAKEGDMRSEQGWASQMTGMALYHLGRFSEAAEHYRQAVEIQQALKEPKEMSESLAGLASTYLALGSFQQALAPVERILGYINENGVEGFEHPLKIFLRCYQVLAAVQDSRARDTLQRGYHLMQEIASRIENEEQRRLFCVIYENQLLAAAWNEG